MDIQQLSDNLNTIVNTWSSLESDFLKGFDADLIDINREQMMEGEDADGKEIGKLQSPEYIQLKKAMGSRAAFAGLADLKFTGAFQDAMYVEHRGDNISIDSRDSKKNKLTKKYGYQIFGVQQQRLDELIKDQIEPEFIDLLSKKMGI